MDTWTCSRCGQTHSETPRSYALNAPWPWHTTPKAERERHCTLTEDCCTLFGKDFFIRGCLEIPILDENQPFIWGVWASLSKEHFEQYRLYPDPISEEKPFFGWMCSRIQMYPDTLLLKTLVQRRSGLRPCIELEPTDHPLAVEQRTGITRARVREIAELFEHKWLHPQWDEKGL